MARISRLDKFSKQERESLLSDLVYALVNTKSINESILFIQDLLTKAELTTLAKRLRIAKLLIAGFTYEEIEKVLHVSHGTIAKINTWLSESGEGFRSIIRKLPEENTASVELSDWSRMKKRYTLYFWPELLLEEIVKSANKRQKQRLHGLLEKLEGKSDLHRRIEKLLKYSTT